MNIYFFRIQKDQVIILEDIVLYVNTNIMGCNQKNDLILKIHLLFNLLYSIV